MVSIVIPLYNVEPYIARCIDSVLNQSYKDFEVIIVDDASQDRSADIAEQYQCQYPNIRILRHEHNHGLMSTRRDGYMAAKGDFILFLDSDDALPQNAVATLVSEQRQTDADIVLGDLLKLYVDGRTERRVGRMSDVSTAVDVLEALIDNRIIHSLCGKLFKTRLFGVEGLQTFDNMTIAEDGCLFYQLVARARKISSVADIMYLYYENKASSSLHVYGESQIEGIIIAYKTIASVCWQYIQLRDKLLKRLTQAMFMLYFEQVSVSKVRKLMFKHDMIKFGSASYARKYLDLKDCWFFIKRFVYVRAVKRK